MQLHSFENKFSTLSNGVSYKVINPISRKLFGSKDSGNIFL